MTLPHVAHLVILLRTYHLVRGRAVVVQAIVLVAHAGIAVFRAAFAPVVGVLAIGVGHVDEGGVLIARLLAWHNHLLTLWIYLHALPERHLLGAADLTNARIAEGSDAGLKVGRGRVVVVRI